LAVGAFIQRAVRAVPWRRRILGDNASIPVAIYAYLSMDRDKFNFNSWNFDVSMNAKIFDASGSPNYTRPTLLQGCTTGNCTFEPLNGTTHVISGYCSKRLETTSLLILEKDLSRYYKGGNCSIKHVVWLPSSS
jgi:hypothetical protein